MATQLINHIYKLKRGTEEAIFERNPILNAGEPIVVLCDDNIVRLKIGDGKTAYCDLPFINQENDDSLRALVKEVNSLKKEIDNAGDTVFLLTKADIDKIKDDSISDQITKAIEYRNPIELITEGNIAIIHTPHSVVGLPDIISSYAYNGRDWEPLNSSQDINTIVFDEDLKFTESVGALKVPSSGHGTISAVGKNLKEVLEQILVKRRNPTITQPTVSLSSSNLGAFEVGTKVRVDFRFSTTAGSYEFGPDTNVKFTTPRAEFNQQAITDMSGTFDEIVVADNTNLSLVGTIKQTAGSNPYDNLGELADGAIKSKTHTCTAASKLTGFRGWFYGYKKASQVLDINSLTSDLIRNLGSGAKVSFPSSMSTAQMQQMFFASPKDSIKSLQVINSVNGAPQSVEKTTVDVQGENGYSAIAYDVFYVSNDNADSSSSTYKISVTR